MNRKLIQTVLAILVASMLLTAPRAQQTTAPPTAEDRVALYQALLDLTNPWTVMCIAAHPDDEDGTSLIVMRRKYGAHTVSLFSTFGEGGQNAIGPELYEELGAIRARETKAAAEIQGSEPHFLGLKDFGFSKSADEAFRFWGHEEALRRMVLEIRKLRPDVIITNHSVTNNDHGHHQATARLELEAFDAAADPTKFPEQLKDGVTVWQVQRLFVRARGNQNQADNASIVTIDPNEKDPVRDNTFAEQALSALQKHATQGPWPKSVAQMASRFTNSADGRLPLTRYRLALEAKGADPLPKDAKSFLDGLRLPDVVARRLEPPTIDGKPLTGFIDQRDRIVTALISAEKDKAYGAPTTVLTTKTLTSDYRLSRMNENLNNALAAELGISATLNAIDPVLIPGEIAKFQLRISNEGSRGAIAKRFWFGEKGGKTNLASIIGPELPPNLFPGKTIAIPLSYDTPTDAELTVPHSSHLYDGRSEQEQLIAGVFIDLGETSFPILANVTIDVAPAVEIVDVAPSPFVITPGTANALLPFVIRLVNHRREKSVGKLGIPANTWGPGIYGFSSEFSLMDKESREVTVPIPKALPGLKTRRSSKIEEGFRFSIGLNHQQSKTFFQRTVPLVYADARVAPNLRIGYIRGFDFSLPNALNALGVESKELSVDEVKTADLQKYTSIIVDNRVYESTPGLIAANQKLLDYAKAGGTLIVFYHKSFEWNPDPRRNRPDQLAPYKLILGDERITDETAPITFLEPQHPLLNFPNKMGQEDFAGWIQERGLYYPKEWDPQFQALLQSNDPGEAPLKGGLLAADYGHGKYIYTSMVWYRELRAGVPGAYRMLANMISYGRGK